MLLNSPLLSLRRMQSVLSVAEFSYRFLLLQRKRRRNGQNGGQQSDISDTSKIRSCADGSRVSSTEASGLEGIPTAVSFFVLMKGVCLNTFTWERYCVSMIASERSRLIGDSLF